MNKMQPLQSSSEILASFAADLKFKDIPAEVIAKAKQHIIDSIGVGIAGSTMDWCERGGRAFRHMGGPVEATLLGQKNKIAMANAAISNGIAIAGMDLDDTDYTGGGGHMSRSVVAAALAAAESNHRTGKDLIKAVVVGYEVATRVGSSLLLDRYGPRGALASWGPEDHAAHNRMREQGGGVMRGYLPGLYASAVVAGSLLGLEAKDLASAQGLVGPLGLFFGQAHREGAHAGFLHAGWSAHSGIIAALWARDGLQGPRFVYEGDRGLLAVIGGDLQDASRLTHGLGTEWNTLNNVLKFYPAGHGTHHFIESLNTLMNSYEFTAEDVSEITCVAPSQRIEYHFLPKEAKLNPNVYNARFSLPYLLARLLHDRQLGPLSFTREKITEAKVLELASRVTYVADESAWFENKRGMVTVKLNDNRTLSQSTPHLLGFPERPCSHDDVINKFRVNAKLVLSGTKSLDNLVSALENLEHTEDIGNIMALTAPS